MARSIGIDGLNFIWDLLNTTAQPEPIGRWLGGGIETLLTITCGKTKHEAEDDMSLRVS